MDEVDVPLDPAVCASRGSRIAAGLIDTVVIGIFSAAISGGLAVFSQRGFGWFLFIATLYGGAMESLLGGKTLGKRLLGLQLVNGLGLPPSVFEALIRQLFKYVLPGLVIYLAAREMPPSLWTNDVGFIALRVLHTAIFSFLITNIAVFLFDPLYRTFYDYFSKTLLIRKDLHLPEDFENQIKAVSLRWSTPWLWIPVVLAIAIPHIQQGYKARSTQMRAQQRLGQTLWGENIQIEELLESDREILMRLRYRTHSFTESPAAWKDPMDLVQRLQTLSKKLTAAHGKMIHERKLILLLNESSSLESWTTRSIRYLRAEVAPNGAVTLNEEMRTPAIAKPHEY